LAFGSVARHNYILSVYALPVKKSKSFFTFWLHTECYPVYTELEMKRGAISKKGSRLVPVWMPIEMIAALDEVVGIEDSDRAKEIRKAVREKLGRLGRPVLPPNRGVQ
jgi:hypothetical protein